MRTVDVLIHGVGNVGRALLALLGDPARFERHGFRVRIVGAVDSRGGVWNPEGIPPVDLLEAKRLQGSVSRLPRGERGLTAIDCLERSATPPVLMESTVVDLKPDGLGFRTMRAFLERRGDAITANHSPLVVGFPQLQELSRTHGGILAFSGTLGLPILSLREHLSHVRIERLEGVVNGTTNYILSEMSQGVSRAEALRRVQAAGLAEADPLLDISGADAASKLLILSHVFLNQPATIQDVQVEGIAGLAQRDLERAALRGEVIKLVASAELRPDGSYRLAVGPRALPRHHPLATLRYTTVGVWLKTDTSGEMTASLTQTEPTPTAAAMVHDLIQSVAARKDVRSASSQVAPMLRRSAQAVGP